MLTLVLVIGFFAYGIQADRLTWKPFALMAAFAAIFVFFSVSRGASATQAGIVTGETFTYIFIMAAMPMFIGYAINRYRNPREKAVEDVTDTFS